MASSSVGYPDGSPPRQQNGRGERDNLPSDTGRRRAAAALIVLAVVLANAAFAGLGSVFNYPDILQESAGEILVEFRADQSTIVALFITLALSAALLAPTASCSAAWPQASAGVSRLCRDRCGSGPGDRAHDAGR